MFNSASKCLWYFKLFNSIKSNDESSEFAKLELENLFGKVKAIYNFVDELCVEPLNKFTRQEIRIQDYITHELPYGRIQGYLGISTNLNHITKLVKRLAYTREIYLIVKTNKHPAELLKEFFPDGVVEKNVQYFTIENNILFRFITNQYFLEKSEYISKLSRNEKEVDKNIDILFSHLTKDIYRIPASINLTIGKRLQDYFAHREEPSLYLTHYFHPYKGKFHPKMVRALLNYVYPYDRGLILDNFAGSGTLLVEANLLELDAIGVEINPLSCLMSNVKCDSLHFDVIALKNYIQEYLNEFSEKINEFSQPKEKNATLFPENLNYNWLQSKSIQLGTRLKNILKTKDNIVPQVLIAKNLLKNRDENQFNDFLLLSLSGTISDVARRTSEQFIDVFRNRLNNLYLRIYLFKKLNEVLKIKLGKSKTYIADTRDMTSIIKRDSINGIINSPPYAVALDYIKNDYLQLVLLELAESIEELGKNMMGNPRQNYDRKELFEKVKSEDGNLSKYTKTGVEITKYLISADRYQAGLRSFKFFIDMISALKEMHRVLTLNSKCAIIIGNNHYTVDNKIFEVPNDRVVLEIAENIGFKVDKVVERRLHKSSEGIIRDESILILQK